MYAAYGGNTERGAAFREALRHRQEVEAREKAAKARRLRIVNERRRAAAEAFEQAFGIYREMSGPAPGVKPPPPVARIILDVAKEHGATYSAIVGPDRGKKIVAIRDAAILRVKQTYPNMSTPKLGKHFGGRDHSTILSSLSRSGYFGGKAS